jgi:hypothetical protein
MNSTEIPTAVLKLAIAPIGSPLWHAPEGSEYPYLTREDWLIANEKVGPYRCRVVCKAIDMKIIKG